MTHRTHDRTHDRTPRCVHHPGRAILLAAPALLAAVAALAGLAACTPYDRAPGFNTLGVLPPQPPKPLWLGDLSSGPSDTTLRGAVAVTPSATPQWSNVLVSIEGGRPGVVYPWTLQAGGCGSAGAAVAPGDRLTPLVAIADGTAAAEVSIPVVLSAGGTYSVTVSPQAGGQRPACATLVRTAIAPAAVTSPAASAPASAPPVSPASP